MIQLACIIIDLISLVAYSNNNSEASSNQVVPYQTTRITGALWCTRDLYSVAASFNFLVPSCLIIMVQLGWLLGMQFVHNTLNTQVIMVM